MPRGCYIRTPEMLENIRMAHRLLWETRREEISHKISVANKGKVHWDKKPSTICRGCGKSFPYKNYRNGGGKYCTQACYLSTNNPRKNPEIIAGIAKGNKGELNASKRPEIRKLISQKLMGRDAWWARKENISDEERKRRSLILSESRRRIWQDPKWAYKAMVRSINGYNFGFALEGNKHRMIKRRVKEGLELNGFSVYEEQPFKIEGKWYIIDILGISDGGVLSIAVECGDCKPEKIKALKSRFDYVEHISYKKWEELKNESKTLSDWCSRNDRLTSCEKVGATG